MDPTTSVREKLQQTYRLRVLRISLDKTEPLPLAVFSLSLFTQADQRAEVAVLTATMSELGLAPDKRPPAFPRRIIHALQSWLSLGPGAGEPLWLRLSSPLGLLPTVAWEQLLQPELGVPVIRLPYQALCPHIPTRETDTVICFSTATEGPENLEQIRQFIEGIPADAARASNFHLFADAYLHASLLELQREFDGRVRIEVYEPPPLEALAQGQARNPWLAWITEEVAKRQQRSVDVVHFLCHSDRSADQGRLVLRREPRAETCKERYATLSAAEIVNFLNEVGAWGVGFTSVGGDDAVAGMRLLQIHIAMLRPGPAFVYDMKADDGPEGLTGAYEFLFAPDHPAPATPALALYCHPILLTHAQTDADSREQLSYTLADKLTGFYQDASPPAWLASAQRKLEMQAGDLAEETDPAVISGRQRALEKLSDTVGDYLKNAGQPGTLEGEHHVSSGRRH